MTDKQKVYELFVTVSMLFCVVLSLLLLDLHIDRYLLCFGGGLIVGLCIIIFKQYNLEKRNDIRDVR